MQAPAHSLKFTRSAIKQAFGAAVEELFEEFEEVPVASGSIGQVYQAKLSAKGARNTGIDPGSAFHSLSACNCGVCSGSAPGMMRAAASQCAQAGRLIKKSTLCSGPWRSVLIQIMLPEQ